MRPCVPLMVLPVTCDLIDYISYKTAVIFGGSTFRLITAGWVIVLRFKYLSQYRRFVCDSYRKSSLLNDGFNFVVNSVRDVKDLELETISVVVIVTNFVRCRSFFWGDFVDYVLWISI